MSQIVFYGFAFLLIASAVNVVLARNAVHSVLSLIFAFFNTAALLLLLGAEFVAMILIIVYVGAVAVLFLFTVMMMHLSNDNQRSLLSRINITRSITALLSIAKYIIVFMIFCSILISIPILAEFYQQHVFVNYLMAQWFKIALKSRWITISTHQGIDVQALCVVLTTCVMSWFVTGHILKRSRRYFTNGFLDSLIFLILAGLIFTLYFVAITLKWQPLAGSEHVISSPIPPLDLMSNTHAIGQILYIDYMLAVQCGGIILLIAIIGAIVLTLQGRHGIKHQNVKDQIARQVQDTLELKNIPLGSGYHE